MDHGHRGEGRGSGYKALGLLFYPSKQIFPNHRFFLHIIVMQLSTLYTDGMESRLIYQSHLSDLTVS